MVGLKALPETEHKTVAVAARSLQSATEFAQTHDIPTAYGSYAELAGDPQVRVCYERFYYEGKRFKETCFLTILYLIYTTWHIGVIHLYRWMLCTLATSQLVIKTLSF